MNPFLVWRSRRMVAISSPPKAGVRPCLMWAASSRRVPHRPRGFSGTSPARVTEQLRRRSHSTVIMRSSLWKAPPNSPYSTSRMRWLTGSMPPISSATYHSASRLWEWRSHQMGATCTSRARAARRTPMKERYRRSISHEPSTVPLRHSYPSYRPAVAPYESRPMPTRCRAGRRFRALRVTVR